MEKNDNEDEIFVHIPDILQGETSLSTWKWYMIFESIINHSLNDETQKPLFEQNLERKYRRREKVKACCLNQVNHKY